MVNVHIYPSFLRRLGRTTQNGRVQLEVPKDSLVRDVLILLDIPLEQVQSVIVNGRPASIERMVVDGDAIGVFPPLGGG